MKIIILFLAHFLVMVSLRTQSLVIDVVGTSGASISISNNPSLDWTVGEISVETYTNQNVLTQGFHQVIPLATRVFPETSGIYSVTIFPNPFSDRLHIKSENVEIVQIIVLDMIGKELINTKVPNEFEFIDLSLLLNGSYVMQIICSEGTPQCFKIQKFNN